MAITVDEKFESRYVTTGQGPAIELRYVVRGTNSQQEATTAMGPASPDLYDPYGSGIIFYPRENVTVQPIGDEMWEAIVRYGSIPQTESTTFTFDTGGGTQHMTQSIQTTGAHALVGKSAPNFKGAVGVTSRDSIEGVDITVPVYHFAETHYLTDAMMTQAYYATLYGLTGRVNSYMFKGFLAGECLFLGAAGAKRAGGDWELAYRFAALPNRDEIVIGDIPAFSKKGWEYLWVRYKEVEDEVADALVPQPEAAYTEQMYSYGDLNLLGI